MPLLMAVGEVRTRRESRRTEIFPSVEATNAREWIHRPTVQISRRCSSSDFTVPGEMESAFIVEGWLFASSLFPQSSGQAPFSSNLWTGRDIVHLSGVNS